MDEAVGWLVALGACYFAFKYLFGNVPSPPVLSPLPSPNPPTPATPGSPNGSTPPTRRQVPQASIDTVSSMFPNIPIAAIRYELERTGNVERTVERALRDGRLPDPPAGFFVDPTAPTPSTAAHPPPASTIHRAPNPPSGSSSAPPGTPASLISRLGLQSRLTEEGSASASEDLKGKGKGKEREVEGREKVGWETNAEARERSLKERKAKMVLEARRKLLAKEQARKEAQQGSSSSSTGGS